MNFDMPLSHTVNPVGEKFIVIRTTGNEKNHFRVVLLCLTDGIKLKSIVIFKSKTMPKETIAPGVVIHIREKGWKDKDN